MEKNECLSIICPQCLLLYQDDDTAITLSLTPFINTFSLGRYMTWRYLFKNPLGRAAV